MLPSFIKNYNVKKTAIIFKLEGIDLNGKKITFYKLQEANNSYFFENKKELIKFLEQKL